MPARAVRPHAAEPVIGAYVFPHGQLDAAHIDAQHLTRIYYSFALIKDGTLVPTTPADLDNLSLLTALRGKNPKLQVLISVGGWMGGAGFSDAALTAESRTHFAQSAAAFVEKYNLDGLDVDWEYPGQAGAGNVFRPEDKQDFTLFLDELRHQFDAAGHRMHRHLLLTIAAGGAQDFLVHTEMDKVSRIVDQVNLMTYDFCEPDPSGTPTCHHTALFTDPADPNHDSVDASVRDMISAGVPAEKIVIGAAFYGHAWTSVSPQNHGLYQPGKPAKDFRGAYDNIRTLVDNRGYTRYWDAAAQAPWLYSETESTFISYDDPQSIGAKCAYVRKQQLGGIMFWSYFDDSTGELLGTINHALNAAR